MIKKLLFVVFLGFVAIVCFVLTRGGKEDVNIVPLSKSWEIAIPNQEIPQGLGSLSAEHCGVCHQQHYEEWKLSTHSHAWTDLQFQAELKKESSPFLCINCHIPLQNQQEFIVTGLVDGDVYQPVKEVNPLFDENLRQEGINCASCHVRNGAVIGPTGTEKAPHKTVKDPVFLSETLCISCHNASAVVTPDLVCTFETGDEWKAGPYVGEQNCISCHMEPLEREIVAGYGERRSHRHYFAGSGIPKFDSVSTKGLNGLGFYPSPLNCSYSFADSIDFKLLVKNEYAGHKVPTGDPERFFLIKFALENSKGQVLKTDTARIGEEWEWYPEAKKLSDNNMLPNEERVFGFGFSPQEKGAYLLSVEVTKHRLNEESAAYNKLGNDYPLFIKIYEKEYEIEVK